MSKKKRVPGSPKPEKTPRVEEILKNRDKELELPEIPGVGEKKTNYKVLRPKILVRSTALAYVPADRTRFSECEYDLGEIARALDTENLINRSVTKHFTLCTKEGWNLTGHNPETIDYIRRRLFEFERATCIAFESIVREVLWNLILFSNSFLVFRRDRELSSGQSIKKFGKDLDPIAGIFCADPSSMRIRRNRWGEVKSYYQRIDGDKKASSAEKFFNPEDVLHFFYARKTGLAWGTPFIVPVLDDIRILRNLEELVNLIAHKGAFPLYHYKIGNDLIPAVDFEDGTSEITDAQSEIESKPIEGVWVTSHRHAIEAVDGQAPIRDLSPYLEHFKMRVLSGLNLSTVDVGSGDTANRGTATQMSKSLQYQCKDYQKVSALTFTALFDDLLEEGGYDVTPENRVFMGFPEIDIETQQLVANHAMALYQGNAIDEDEMRKDMGKEPFKPDQHEKRHLGRVQMPQLELERQAQASIAKEKASEKATANKNRPTNQSGKKGSAGSRKNDELEVFLGAKVNHTIDALSEIFSHDLSTIDRSLLIRTLVDEVLDGLAPLPGLRELLIERSSGLYAASRDNLSTFIDPLRAVFCQSIVDTLRGAENVLSPEESLLEEKNEDEGHIMVRELADALKDLRGEVVKLGDRPTQPAVKFEVAGMEFKPEIPAPVVHVDVKVPEQQAPKVDVRVDVPAPKVQVDVAAPAQPEIRFEPKIIVNPTPIHVSPTPIQVHPPKVEFAPGAVNVVVKQPVSKKIEIVKEKNGTFRGTVSAKEEN